ncbi:Uncharacterised protein [uncultured archaeon]|nr:Uncharacterised protein [uncultured archaeon]
MITNCSAASAQTLTDGFSFASLTGVYNDTGLDINHDGLLEYLNIDVGVHITYPGEYSLNGYLYDRGGREIVWSADHRNFTEGDHIMQLAFDGKTIEKSKLNGPYRLGNLTFNWGSASMGLVPCAFLDNAYTTSLYNASNFVDPINKDRHLSGSGKGELLVTLSIKTTLPVFSGRYMYDVVGLNMPPLSTPVEVKGSRTGYDLSLPGIFVPKKPNNFTLIAGKVKNINVGVMKLQGDLERTWVSSQFLANESGMARADTDLISPRGSYHVKVFGDAADSVTEVSLLMSVVKKLVVSGPFNLIVNTTGFPSGNYSLAVKALNGSFAFDNIQYDD